jgi:hypothetical protein
VKPKSGLEASEIANDFKPENLSLKTSPLRCERVNDSTFKITDGELTNVPGSHGQWAGYRTTKALAWIIKLESDAWLARFSDQVCGPSSFSEARRMPSLWRRVRSVTTASPIRLSTSTDLVPV